MSQGVTLTADLNVTFSQRRGVISGSFALSGILTSETLLSPIQGAGNFSGTIDPGEHPSVEMTFESPCPDLTARYSGTFESATDLLTISGPAHIIVNCVIVLTFETTILMERVVLPEDVG
jgi:hypothetical protein